MWPYCGIRDAALDPGDPRRDMVDWECIRGIVLGVVSMVVFAVGAYAVAKIGAVFLRTRWYGLNLFMLGLATIQCLLTTIKYLLYREQKLTFSAAYFRGLQTLLASVNYAKSAAESSADADFFSKFYVPVLGVLVVYLSMVYLVAMGKNGFECYHPHWMVMSVSQFLIVCLFSIPGLAVMAKLSGAISSQGSYSTFLNEGQGEAAQQRRGLRVLLVVNGVGAVAQLVLDSWLQTLYKDEQVCVIFDSGFEEFVRILLKLLSYDLPVLATVYVFYYLPRRQFQSELDIRLPAEDGLDEAFSTELVAE